MSLQHGLPLPEAIENAPQLQFGLNLFFSAWLELVLYAEGDRIGYSDVIAYSNEHDFHDGQRFRLVEYIGAINIEYASIMSKKRKAEQKRLERQKGKKK